MQARALPGQAANAPATSSLTAYAAGVAVPTSQQASSGPLPSMLPDVNLSWSGYFEALAILCFVLALLWGALWLVKKSRSGAGFLGSSGQALRVESRLSLGPKKWILAVRYMDRRLVLGVTDLNISLLSDMPAEESVALASTPQSPPRISTSKKFPLFSNEKKQVPPDNPFEDSLAAILDKDKGSAE